MNYDFSQIRFTEEVCENINIQFLNLYNTINNLQKDNKVSYENMFEQLIILANSLNLTKIEIYQAYINKNKVNHQRQINKY